MPEPVTGSFEQLLERYERIIEISQQLNSTLDHSALLSQIIEAAMELTNCEAASILLIDPGTGELRFEQASNLDANEISAIIVPMEGSIAGWVVTHGEARVIEDVRQEPSFFKSVDDILKFRTHNLLAVPLRTRSKVIGALEAVNKFNGEPFNNEDIRILTTLAGQAAIAIENSRLFQQSDFMAEMVHELRTPLAALKTSISLINRPELSPERRTDIMATMSGETDRLIRMTSDFLDLARLESGRARLETVPFALAKLVEECTVIIMPQAGEKELRIQADIPDLTVIADRGKIKQVLLNLLTNAVKYNRPHGTITVEAFPRSEQRSADGSGRFAEIAVIDTGYGISKDNQKQMFQKFYRAADSSAYAQGTGLGLAIAKHIIEGHKGDIWLESDPESGSRFAFTLPLAPV